MQVVWQFGLTGWRTRRQTLIGTWTRVSIIGSMIIRKKCIGELRGFGRFLSTTLWIPQSLAVQGSSLGTVQVLMTQPCRPQSEDASRSDAIGHCQTTFCMMWSFAFIRFISLATFLHAEWRGIQNQTRKNAARQLTNGERWVRSETYVSKTGSGVILKGNNDCYWSLHRVLCKLKCVCVI